jgi:GDP-L-fucose synthase
VGFWDGRKVLVTGGAGFIGSHVVEDLLARSPSVRVVVADALPSERAVFLSGVRERISYERADLRSEADCARVCEGAEAVLHVAAKVGGLGYNLSHPATMFRENVRMASRMLEAAQLAGAERFLLVSSACVYPRHCPIPTPETEGFSGWPEPTNEGYGWAKRMGEFEAMAVHKEFGLRVAIARPYNAYGPRDNFDPASSHVIAALVRRALSGENPLRVWGDGSATRSFLFAADMARGLVDTVERYAECDPVNLGSDEEISVADLARLIADLSGPGKEVVFDPSKPAGQPRRRCDTRKAREKVGFSAAVGLREGLRRTIEWCRENGGER